MFRFLLEFVFGCHHRNYSFPITLRSGKRRTRAASLTGTYVVCLNCGRELAYDWNAMRVITNLHKSGSQAATVTAEQAA